MADGWKGFRRFRLLAWGGLLLLAACARPPEPVAEGPPRLEPATAKAPAPVKRRRARPDSGILASPVDTGSFRLASVAPRAQADAGPPIELVSADGKPLTLRSVASQTVVVGALAFTELQLSFKNPEARTIEGRFRIALPEGASLSRFAMRVGSSWQEGEVVEKKRARRTYEDFLHRRVDPALLEQTEGNSFSARVFPIPAGADKQLIISYSQEVEAGDTLVPLAGLGAVERVVLDVTPDTGKPLHVEHQGEVPKDLRFEAAETATGLRQGSLVIAPITPMTAASPAPLGPTLVLIDSSASRALGFEQQLQAAKRVVAQVTSEAGADAAVTVACFDQTVQVIHDGRAGDFDEAALDRARARRALGASNLGGALAWARGATQARSLRRVVLIGDGVVTAGAEKEALLAQAKALAPTVERIDAIVFGGIHDRQALTAVVTAGLAEDGVVLDGALAPAALAKRLGSATRSDLAVTVEGARWWWPKRLRGVQPGDRFTVYAEVPGGGTPAIQVDGAPVAPARWAEAPRPLVERAWAKAKIESLLEEERRAEETPEASAQRASAIVALSTQHRVLSPYTSLLVLETQADYDRFGLAREALADILTVRGGKLRLEQHPPPARGPKPPPQVARRPAARTTDDAEFGMIGLLSTGAGGEAVAPWGRDDSLGADPLSARGQMWGDEVGDAFGAGGLGLSGVGEGGGGRGEGVGLGQAGSVGHGAGSGTGQGFGSGSGRLAPSHRVRAPRVRMGATQVSGRLPPEVIQRIVRQNFGRFRGCYQLALRQDPHLAGRIVARFVIGRDGSVANATAEGMGDRAMEACVAAAFRALSFPVPEGGIVTVSYPIVFQPEGAEAHVRVPAPQRMAPSPPTASPSPPAAPPSPPAPSFDESSPMHAQPYRGRFASVMAMLKEGDPRGALAEAQAWQAVAPGEVLAVVALGEALEAAGQDRLAARAYGSIIDLFPSRADLRRFAAARLERLDRDAGALPLAVDSYATAREQRPDHPTSHRLHAFALLKTGDPAGAAKALVAGLEACKNRFAAAAPILRADLALVSAAWLAARPEDREKIERLAKEHGFEVAHAPSLHFVLNWETDTNDVDLHLYDSEGSHAFYGQRALRSGGRLFGDVTTGYGPELFQVEGEGAAGYFLQAHYYARGPMGYGMGKLQIIRHDGKGGLEFDERPFVVQVDGAYVDLGTLGRYEMPSKALSKAPT
ncbi:MAG: VIT domain-containing protein [Polyangiaceae bacterium]